MNCIPIVYEDNDICIINKPAGLAVQGGKGVSSSVDNLLSEQQGCKMYLVHRLDKDTSGLLITAKHPAAAAVWTKRIASAQVVKQYYALCIGSFSSLSGSVSQPVVHKGLAKDALTFFSVEKQSRVTIDADELCFSLVRLKLGTGRMHQIRIHLAGQGTPIAGDDKYGNFSLNRLLRKYCGIKKLHLAAIRLEFSEACRKNVDVHTAGLSDKIQKLPRYCEIPLPEYIMQTLAALQFAP